MVNYQGASLEEQVKELLEENLAYSKEMYSTMKKVQRTLLISRIVSIVYIILIVGPIILGIIYLPGIFKNTLNSFLPAGTGSPSSIKDLLKDGSIIDAYKEVLDLQKSQ